MSKDKKAKSNRVDTGTREKNLIRSLRQKITKKDHEIRRLKSELATLNRAFQKTGDFLKDSTEGIEVNRLIDAANDEMPLEEIKLAQEEVNTCPECREVSLFKVKSFNFQLVMCTKEDCDYRYKERLDAE